MIENDFFGNTPNEHVDTMEFSFSIGLLRTFGFQYFSLAILRFLADGLTFSGPILLHMLVTSLQTGDPEVKNLGNVKIITFNCLEYGLYLCESDAGFVF